MTLNMKKHKVKKKNIIKVIIVDDSSAFRLRLRQILNGSPDIEIVGEATNGIEALELIIKTEPDVILMAFEMPLMDGMTALQHLMIHTPTPTIMFSRLTREGTARCFDSLKNGAVDFLRKDDLDPGRIAGVKHEEIIKKIISASSVVVKAVEPIFFHEPKREIESFQLKKLIFCEECGSKIEISGSIESEQGKILCDNCGEHIILEQKKKYIRTSFVSIIVSGKGAYINLLKLIPSIQSGMTGTLLILIDGTVQHVDAFSEYLDAISTVNVVRIKDGLPIEGGNCYIGCDNENIFLKPYSAQYTLKFSKETDPEISPMDLTIASFSKILKNRTSVIFLSGEDNDGELGVEMILKNGGSVMVLDPSHCLYKDMAQNIIARFSANIVSDEESLAQNIAAMFFRLKDSVVTA